MHLDVYVVQHGEKAPTGGDPALSPVGMEQAQLTARHLVDCRIERLYSSPLRRARETAEIVAATLGITVRLDARLRERMNWGDSPVPQTREDFLAEWERATWERYFRPRSGDSSRAAGERAAALLDDLTRQGIAVVALVTHGGVTVDLLRNLFPDAIIRAHTPDVDVITEGIPGGAITHLVRHGTTYELRALALVVHLPAYGRTRHQR
jgi:broad specificity phosphatase PhoE